MVGTVQEMENEIDEDEFLENESTLDEKCAKRSRLPRRLTEQQSSKKLCAKEERNAEIKKVSTILQKRKDERTQEENQVLIECQEAVDEVHERRRKRDELKRRLEEFEESEDELDRKCLILAQAIAQSQHLVVYTGAGISTAAKIPDYRGPNGIWTRLQQGRDIGIHDLTLAEPTYTHMALSELYRKNILKYVVSQNCDGLHLRSGLPKTALSELHGNMYIEVCKICKPHKEYWRLFDVTESTARYSHKTYRRCYSCNEPLIDSIVHFGERGSLAWPLNWSGACKNAAKATTILCLGSSLKVLKKYPWLWQMDKPVKKRPNLYIVNLQWTPKDDVANVKINGKCDVVIRKVMEMLGISVNKYNKYSDPIFSHATIMHKLELHTTTRPSLSIGKNEELDDDKKDCLGNLNQDLNSTPVNCDNSNKYGQQCLPDRKKSLPSNVFTIENLLQPSSVQSHSVPESNTSNYFSNPSLSLFSYNLRMLTSYPNFFLYPYQTSFLYSGLHSIINPLPTYLEDFEITPKIEKVKIEPACEYCNVNYNSVSCLFYKRVEPVFNNQKYRYSKVEKRQKPNVCICCDYSTDEEDLDNDNDKDQSRNTFQPGWFGKGYKKGRRAKRKTN